MRGLAVVPNASHAAMGIVIASAAVLIVSVRTERGAAVPESRNTIVASTDPSSSVLGQVGGVVEAVAQYDERLFVGVGARLIEVGDVKRGRLEVRGTTPVLSDSVHSIAVDKSYAYVGLYYGGLRIFDVNQGPIFVQVGSVSINGFTMALHLRGDTVYLATNLGLYVIDVSDRKAPLQIFYLSTTGISDAAWDVVTAEGVAFVLTMEDQRGYIHVLDTSHLPDVSQQALIELGFANFYHLALANNLLYVMQQYAGVLILDAASSTSVEPIGGYDMPAVVDIEAAGDRLYVAGAAGSGYASAGILEVVSVAEPASPQVEARYEDRAWRPRSLSIANGRAYIPDSLSGYVRVFDVQAPGQLEEVDRFRTMKLRGAAFAEAGERLLVTDLDGVSAVDVGRPRLPQVVEHRAIWLGARDVATAGDYTYVVEEERVLVLPLDRLDAEPLGTIEPELPDGSALARLEHSGTSMIMVYDTSGSREVSPSTTILTVDAANLAAPRLLGSTSYTRGQRNVTRDTVLVGQTLYIVQWHEGVRAVDLTDLSSPELLTCSGAQVSRSRCHATEWSSCRQPWKRSTTSETGA